MGTISQSCRTTRRLGTTGVGMSWNLMGGVVGDHIQAGLAHARADAVDCPWVAVVEDMDSLPCGIQSGLIDALNILEVSLRTQSSHIMRATLEPNNREAGTLVLRLTPAIIRLSSEPFAFGARRHVTAHD